MGLHVAHNVAMLQVLVSTAATHLAGTSLFADTADNPAPRTNPPSPLPDPNPQTLDPLPSPQAPNASTLNAFFRLMREFRASLKLLAAPAHHPLNRQNHGVTHPTPEGILRHAQRTQHDASLDPDSIAGAQLQPQTPHTHAEAFVRQAALAGGQSREVEMCETFDNATMLDEPYADSERDHVLASFRPAKQTVSEELAAEILGNLHLPPLPAPEQDESATANNDHSYEKYAEVLQHYLDVFRDGKIPPEAFAKNTPIRAYAESIYTGGDHAPA